MDIIIEFILLLLIIIGLFFIITIIFYLKNKYKFYIREKKYNEFLNLFVDYAFDNNIEICSKNKCFLKEKKEYLKMNIKDDILIEALINNINSFSGHYRLRLISLAEELKIIENLYLKVKNSISERDKIFNLYLLGQFRSISCLERILDIKINKRKKDFIFIYFYSILNIVEEKIFELDEYLLKRYIDKIFEIIRKIDKEDLNIKNRIWDYFLNVNKKFFSFINKNETFFYYLMDKYLEKNLSLETKGLFFYVFSLNNEYRIFPYVKKEFYYYLDKENKTNEEKEYLIKLLKSVGELKIEDSVEILLKVLEKDDRVLKILGVKYLSFFPEYMDKIAEFIYDKNWQVRYNSAIGILNYGIEGIGKLFEIIIGNDKYASEIAAFALSESEYTNNLIKDIGFNQNMITNEVMILINLGKSIKFADEILNSDKIGNNFKTEFLKKIDFEILKKYKENYKSKISRNEFLDNLIEKRLKGEINENIN